MFRPYHSALARYPLSRQGPLPPAVTSSSDSLSEANTDAVSRMGLASWVAQRRGVDVNKRLCKAEAGGGRCHDRTCKCVHIASFVPTGMSTLSETNFSLSASRSTFASKLELRASTYARTGAFSPHARRSRGVRRIQSTIRCFVVCIRLQCCSPRLRKSPMQAAAVDIAESASRLSRLYTHLSPVATISSRPLLGHVYYMQMRHAVTYMHDLCEKVARR